METTHDMGYESSVTSCYKFYDGKSNGITDYTEPIRYVRIKYYNYDERNKPEHSDYLNSIKLLYNIYEKNGNICSGEKSFYDTNFTNKIVTKAAYKSSHPTAGGARRKTKTKRRKSLKKKRTKRRKN